MSALKLRLLRAAVVGLGAWPAPAARAFDVSDGANLVLLDGDLH